MKYTLLYLLGLFIAFTSQSCLESTDNSKDLQVVEKNNLKIYLEKLKLELKNDPNNIDDSIYMTKSGLYYIIKKFGDSASVLRPAERDYLRANITWSLTDETRIIKTNDSTKLPNTLAQFSTIKGPILFYYTSLDNFFTEGLYEGIHLMRNNSRYKFIVPSNLGYGEYFIEGEFGAYTTLVYDVELIKIVLDPNAEDSIRAKNWVDSLGLIATDASKEQIFFKEIVSGTSTESLEGKTVTVKYDMKLLDGRYISSNTSSNITFVVGDINTTKDKGFYKAVGLMHKGSSAIAIIPHEMAYDTTGGYNSFSQVIIPPYSSIYYKLEVTDVK